MHYCEFLICIKGVDLAGDADTKCIEANTQKQQAAEKCFQLKQQH